MRILWISVCLFVLILFVGCAGLPKPASQDGGDRDAWQQPERVIGHLGIRKGDIIADLGAGDGYFTFRLADATGPSGKVYAVDIDSSLLGILRRRARQNGCQTVETIHAAENDPKLPPVGVDLIFFCNAYHCLTDRADFLPKLRSVLRPGGRVAILDFKGSGDHAIPEETIRSEMLKAGYRLDKTFDYLEDQSFQIFCVRGR